MDIDAQTGLPALPEGLYWRVRDAYRYGPVELRLELMVRMPWYRRDYPTQIVTPHTGSAIGVQRAAEVAYNQWKRECEQLALVGNYPPKKLEIEEENNAG